MKVSVVQHGPPVNHSERTAIERIKSRLISEPGDDPWCLLTNILFSADSYRQSDEIDIVAIGPPGVRIIEVKHWSYARLKSDPDGVEEEADRLTMKARRLAGFLRRKVPNIGFVEGVFLLTQSASKTKGVDEAKPVKGVSFHSLKACDKAIGLRGETRLSPSEMAKLIESLTKPGDRKDGAPPKRVGSYMRLKEVDAPISDADDFCRIYKAEHYRHRSSSILYLYDLTSQENLGSSSDIRSKAERQWQALHRLQRYSWVPRIIDSFQDLPEHLEELCFFTIQDPAAPNILKRREDESWDIDARLEFCRKAVEALRELHEFKEGPEGASMVHRNLNPSTILVGKDNSPILTGFNYARIPAQQTIATVDTPKGLAGEYQPPEIIGHGFGAADRRSDVYSLCSSLKILFSEDDSEADPKESLALEALSKGVQEKPDDRIALSALYDALKELEKPEGSQKKTSHLPSPRYWTEGEIIPYRDRRYKIVSFLGKGGGGIAFRVEEVDEEGLAIGTSLVAKVVPEREKSERSLKAYKLAESRLAHLFSSGEKSLSKIIDVADEWEEKSFVALMSWIPGEPFEAYSEYLGLYAEETQDESESDLVLRWLGSICRVLKSFHDNNLVHGDISPRNLIVSSQNLVVIDYDHVAKIGEEVKGIGTLDYSAYSSEENIAKPSNDFYSLAASFFKILYCRDPFKHEGDFAKNRGLSWDGLDRERYGAISDFLDKATDPDPSQRFESAKQALAFLDSIQTKEVEQGIDQPAPTEKIEEAPKAAKPKAVKEPVPKKTILSDEIVEHVPESERKENQIEFLHSLLQSYPGSKRGNQETRGLDSKFAEDTYVKTELFDVLLKDIKTQRKSLIILCGNAGDGKTAILQRLAKDLGIEESESSSRRILEKNIDGVPVHINLDGSASWEGKTSDELLDISLKPFLEGKPESECVHLVAINDGRLLEWIEDTEKKLEGETPLTEELDRCIKAVQDQDELPSDSHIRFVSLNQRSLVGDCNPEESQDIDTTFLESLLDKFYGGDDAKEIWTPCITCTAQDRCDILNAARLFAPSHVSLPRRSDDLYHESRRERARERLFEMLQAVHLRGEKHITMRELRASLTYILFGIHHCTDYHRPEGIPKEEASVWWDRAFSPRSPARQGEVLSELVRFDPALESHPQIDRYLLSRPYIKYQDKAPRYPGNGRQALSSARRWAYFSWSEGEVEDVAGDAKALDLARGRHFRDFRNLEICSDEEREKLRDSLCKGISQIENLPPMALDREGVVPLRITPRTPTETAFWVEKEIGDFILKADGPPVQPGVHRFHHQATLVYRYKDGKTERLQMGADLFHLLLELGEGHQLGDISSDDVFAQLSIFVQRLVKEDDRRLLAWNPMNEDKIYEIAAKERSGPEGKQPIVIKALEEG